MKKPRKFLIACFLILILFFPAPLSLRAAEEDGTPKRGAEKKGSIEKWKEKAKEEGKEIKKEIKKAGQNLKESYKELPDKAKKEFHKTGEALEETRKSLKEHFQETLEDLKNIFKKEEKGK